jgi:hypothetical protein
LRTVTWSDESVIDPWGDDASFKDAEFYAQPGSTK